MDVMVGASFVCDGVSMPVAMLMDVIKLIPVHETCWVTSNFKNQIMTGNKHC
jgi:hypothetical protein